MSNELTLKIQEQKLKAITSFTIRFEGNVSAKQAEQVIASHLVFRRAGEEQEVLRIAMTSIFFRTKRGQLKAKWYDFVQPMDLTKLESKFEPILPVKVAIYVR